MFADDDIKNWYTKKMNEQSPQVSRVQYSSHVSNGMKFLARPVRQMEQYLTANFFAAR